MTSARSINVQHPKNAGAIVRTTKMRPNLPEEAKRVV